MAQVNVPQTLEWLYEMKTHLDANRAADESDDGARYKATADEIQKRLITLRKIAEREAPERAAAVDERGVSYTWFWGPVNSLVTQLIGALEEDERSAEMLGPTGPTIAASQLHPWVWEASARLWDDGHRKMALQGAATAIELQLKAKLGLSGTATDLVTKAFTISDPKPDECRLRFKGFDHDKDAWTSAHEGAMNFGRGCMMRIRNLATHSDGEPDEQPALEQLAALSVLARWIDEAEVVTA